MFEDILGHENDPVELSEEEMKALAEELLAEDCCSTDGCCVSPSPLFHEDENTGCAGSCGSCGH